MNSYNIGLEDRKIIEEMYNAGAKPCEIAARIGICWQRLHGTKRAANRLTGKLPLS